eukprot:m.53643 g.53643  ORF g.53643 m.53643 type:complete len:78 (+) comp11374_c1_seq2:3659-3892(+)
MSVKTRLFCLAFLSCAVGIVLFNRYCFESCLNEAQSRAYLRQFIFTPYLFSNTHTHRTDPFSFVLVCSRPGLSLTQH